MKQDSDIRIFLNAVGDCCRGATRTEIFAMALVLLGVLNFTVFLMVCVNIGGSAGNGGIRDGRHFVSEHGRESEVSARTFEMNLVHGRSLFITHPLAMLGILTLATSSRKRSRPRRLQPEGK